MKGRRSSAVPLLRRNSDSFTQSIDSDPSKCLNVELLQPTIQEKEEEPSVFIDNDCLEKHPHCMSVPDKYNTNYVTVSGIKSGDISSTYDALPCNWINYVKMLAACITFLPVVSCINYPCYISCLGGKNVSDVIFPYKVGSCHSLVLLKI